MAGLKQKVARGISRTFSIINSVSELAGNPEPDFRVLMYHAVETAIPEDRLGLYTLSRPVFHRHAKALSQLEHYPIVEFAKAMSPAPGLAITFDDGYCDTLTEIAPVLCEYGLPFTVFVITDFVKDSKGIYLSSAQLKELAGMPGVTIGSHGASHKKLITCSDKQLREELGDSKAFLEDLLQKEIETLSYPHGAVDERVMDFVADSGYRLAASSRFGTNHVGQHPLNLKRTDIWSTDSTSDLNSKIRGNWDWMGIWS